MVGLSSCCSLVATLHFLFWSSLYHALSEETMGSHSLHVNRHQDHLKWSKAIPPVLKVESGSTVTFEALDASNGQVTKSSKAEDLLNFATELADPVYGPVYVEGAEPGDALEVEVLDLKTADWAWTAIMPNFGLLADDFQEPHLKIWDLSGDKPYADFKEGIRIPLRPFLGEMGVAPEADGEFSTIPPLNTGGNIDCRHLTVGSKLFLPVKTPGALFSCGDGHAAQGDGEVCGTAIETAMNATLRLTVRKNHDWVASPHYFSPPLAPIPGFEDRGSYACLGINSDLLEATRDAVRGIINYLTATKGLTRAEAYMVASIAVDLKMAEVVDLPNFGIAATLPLNIFQDQ
jgi:acetamidase/formamidase